MSPRKKSVRMSISVPTGLHDEIARLADRLDSTESAAVRMLLLLGVEAMQGSKSPFKGRKKI